MAIERLPAGTRGGGRMPGLLAKVVVPMMIRAHRRKGDTFRGMPVLYLTTTGAKSGQQRVAPVARFAEGDGWLVVASAGGARSHPGWYHNVVAHPDQVFIEVGGVRQHVHVQQLSGEERERAWRQVVAEQPGFEGYTRKTDRELPVLRLTPRVD